MVNLGRQSAIVTSTVLIDDPVITDNNPFFTIRAHSHMTSTLRGIGPKADKFTDGLRDCDSDKGGGG